MRLDAEIMGGIRFERAQEGAVKMLREEQDKGTRLEAKEFRQIVSHAMREAMIATADELGADLMKYKSEAATTTPTTEE